jgi:hypothetical protein
MKAIIQPRFIALALLAGSLACNGTAPDTISSPTPTGITSSAASAARAPIASGSTCATGDGVNDAGACNADAQAFCGGLYGANWQAYAREHGYTTASWKYSLLDCLGRHDVSAACTSSLDRREVLNEQMMTACVSYCRGTRPQPGAEPCVDHLKSIYDSLDASCRMALDAHEGAKAIDGRCSI